MKVQRFLLMKVDIGYLSKAGMSPLVVCWLTEEGVEASAPLPETEKFMRADCNRPNSFSILQAVRRKLHKSKECTSGQFRDPIITCKLAGVAGSTTKVSAQIKRNV